MNIPLAYPDLNKQLPVIFLDIDGVLNSQLFYLRQRETGIARRSGTDQENLDEVAVGFLNELTKFGAQVVISSTWRKGRTVAELQSMLNEAGFIGTVIDKTGTGSGDSLRGNEILTWIKQNEKTVGARYYEYHRYVILDDNSDMLYWQRNNYLWIDPYAGLTPNIVWQAKKKLFLPQSIADITEGAVKS